jgi:hypothetical protein
MAGKADGVFQRAVSKLLLEIFDGPPAQEAYVLNPGDPGLLRQLESISAATASAQPIPGKPGICAHLDHVNFGMLLLARYAAGDPNPWEGADWNASWRRTTVSEEEWRTLRDDLRRNAEEWRRGAAARVNWNDVDAAGAISSVAHTAYHLGSIRQILAATGETLSR